MKTKFPFQYKYESWKGEKETINEVATLKDLKGLIHSIKSPNYSHCRARHYCGVWITHIYHFNRESPSGVLQNNSGRSELVDPLIRRYRNNSPLSPTEFY